MTISPGNLFDCATSPNLIRISLFMNVMEARGNFVPSIAQFLENSNKSP
ncbi:6762_t:CDS:1, partial [Acaulospora morrowiae]